MIKVGLVGCGHIGTVHGYAIRQLTKAGLIDAALTDTYDTDGERAARAAERFHATRRATLEELVASVDAGRAVFCEKPLAPTYADCERVAMLLARVPHQVEP